MGATIAIAWLCTAWLAVLLLIQRLPDRANALAVRFGLLVGLGGMMVGFLMTLPTKAQLDLPEGEAPTIIGAHSVGVADGGPGLPLVNWSTTGGDLRAGHFIGMHALQALPLLGFLLVLASRRFARLRFDRVRTRLVIVAGRRVRGAHRPAHLAGAARAVDRAPRRADPRRARRPGRSPPPAA